MAKKLGRKLAGVILCSLLLAAGTEAPAQTETPATPQLPDLGQLLPASPNPPGPQYMITDQPPEARPPRSQNRRPRPPAPARAKPQPEEQSPAQSQAAAPPQTEGEQSPGSPLRLTEAMAAAGDLSPLRGCWVGDASAAKGCEGFSVDICFDERGQGQMTIEAGGLHGTIRAPAQAAYENGQLVINVGGASSFIGGRFSRFRIKCALRGEEAADCAHMVLDDFACAYGAGWIPASLKRR
jgi:hypothetical protein